MAHHTTNLNSKLDAFAAPFVASGQFSDTGEVLDAAMDAFLLAQADQAAIDKVLLDLAEEGEGGGLADGDIFETVLAKYSLKSDRA